MKNTTNVAHNFMRKFTLISFIVFLALFTWMAITQKDTKLKDCVKTLESTQYDSALGHQKLCNLILGYEEIGE